MIPFFKKIKYFLVLILISFIAACSSDNDNNLPAVKANFTYFIDGTTGTVEFTNTSTNADSYFWNLGNGNTTTEENPIDVYTESGEYTVQLIAENISGGSDTISQIIEISLPEIPVMETVTLPLDFELDTTNYEITDFDGGNLTVVANPFSDDINSSAQVGKMIKNDGQTWGGSTIALEEAIDFSTNKTFQAKVYSPRAGAKVLLKVENADDSSINYEIEAETTKANEWETLTFDYSSVDTSQTYNKVILIFDNGTAGDGSDNFTFYIDDIELVSGGETTDPTAPATAAPVPTQDAAGVISIYSDAYTNITGVDYNPGWGQATVQSEVAIEGNNTMLYTGLNYQGIDFAGNAQDVSGMTHLHIDYWTQNSTTLNTYLISSGPVETAKALTVPTTGWVSIDIPLADFSPVDLADVIQMKFDGDGDIYLDNIYFYNQGGAVDTTAPVITLEGEATMNLTVGDTFTDPGFTATDDTDGDITANVVVAGDTVDTNIAGTYVITYNVSDAAENVAAEVTRTVVVSSTTNEPVTAAPTPPTRDAADVISLFSDAYSNITVSEWSTGWDDADIEDFMAGGNVTKKITFGNQNGGFLGVDFSANAFDATSMTHFHMDYWIADEIATGQILNPKWSNHDGGAEVNAFEYTNPVNQSGQWISIDIPITDFGGDTLRDNVAQFILATGNTLNEVYVDNIYFYKTASSGGSQDNVVSIFSDDYTNIAVNEWGPNWGDSSSRIIDGTLEGSPAKIMTVEADQVFAGIDFSSAAFDATTFTTFHMDYKVDPILAGQVIVIKLSNHSGGNGETGAIQYTSVPSDTNVVSLAIPLDDFTDASGSGDLSRDAIAQIVITAARADGSQPVNVYLDNIYFSK